MRRGYLFNLIFSDDRRTESLVIKSDLSALPNAKLTRCSRSSSSDTSRLRASSRTLLSAGLTVRRDWNCFRAAMHERLLHELGVCKMLTGEHPRRLETVRGPGGGR